MEELEATATQGTQATQPADPGPLESAPESAELVVKLLKNLGTPWERLEVSEKRGQTCTVRS